MVNWCFEPSQPLGIISGLKGTFIKRHVVERTSKAEIGTRLIMINGTWKRSLLDVRVKRGTNVGGDHHLVTAFIKLKLRSAGRRMTALRCFDTEKLRDPEVKSAFVLQVKN